MSKVFRLNIAKSWDTLAPGQQFYYSAELVTVIHGPLRIATVKAVTPHEPWQNMGNAFDRRSTKIRILKPALPTTRDKDIWWYIRRADGYEHALGITGFCSLDRAEAKKVSAHLTEMVEHFNRNGGCK